jgi:hypothetical protein
MLYKEIITLCSKNQAKHLHSVDEIFYVKRGGAYSNHQALNQVFMARGHARYCGLVHEPHVEK